MGSTRKIIPVSNFSELKTAQKYPKQKPAGSAARMGRGGPHVLMWTDLTIELSAKTIEEAEITEPHVKHVHMTGSNFLETTDSNYCSRSPARSELHRRLKTQ